MHLREQQKSTHLSEQQKKAYQKQIFYRRLFPWIAQAKIHAKAKYSYVADGNQLVTELRDRWQNIGMPEARDARLDFTEEELLFYKDPQCKSVNPWIREWFVTYAIRRLRLTDLEDFKYYRDSKYYIPFARFLKIELVHSSK